MQRLGFRPPGVGADRWHCPPQGRHLRRALKSKVGRAVSRLRDRGSSRRGGRVGARGPRCQSCRHPDQPLELRPAALPWASVSPPITQVLTAPCPGCGRSASSAPVLPWGTSRLFHLTLLIGHKGLKLGQQPGRAGRLLVALRMPCVQSGRAAICPKVASRADAQAGSDRHVGALSPSSTVGTAAMRGWPAHQELPAPCAGELLLGPGAVPGAQSPEPR